MNNYLWLFVSLCLFSTRSHAGPSLTAEQAESLGRIGVSARALGAAAAGQAQETCYKLYRTADWRPVGEPDAPYKRLSEWNSPISTRMIPNIDGIMTVWSHQVRAENLWLTDLKITASGLEGNMTFEKNDFPMDETWDVIWKRRQSLPLDTPVTFFSRILDRQFRATLVWSVESDRSKCHLPWESKP